MDICLQVGLALVLDVVVERHDDLAVVVDLGGTNGHELHGHGPRVVVGHAVVRREGHIVAGPDLLPGRQADRVPLDDLLGQSLGGVGCGFGRGQACRSAVVLELRVEGILPQYGGRGVGGGAGSEGRDARR